MPPPAPPPAPWDLEGAAVLMGHGWRSALGLVHYETSPVGPYDELAVIQLTRRGPTVTKMWVTSLASLRGGRANWGYPKELGQLHWQWAGQRVLFRAGPRYWWLRPWGPSFPVRAKAWTMQTLNGQSVQVPFEVQGRARLAWRGRQIALLVDSFAFTVEPPKVR